MVKSGREMGENLAYYYAFTPFSQKLRITYFSHTLLILPLSLAFTNESFIKRYRNKRLRNMNLNVKGQNDQVQGHFFPIRFN